jgi:hypothetical protein
MPIEHNLRQEDHYPMDPPGFERWFELDVDEGGFGPGLHGTAISWQGIWPQYKKIQNRTTNSAEPLDRLQPHVFGVSYNAKTLTATWWVDGEAQLSAGSPEIPDIARQQHFYLIVSAQTRKDEIPYTLYLYGMRAFVGE